MGISKYIKTKISQEVIDRIKISQSLELFIEGEIWKDIPEFYGYQASNFGRVRSIKNGRFGIDINKAKVRKQRRGGEGRRFIVDLSMGEMNFETLKAKKRTLFVSRIIGITFYGTTFEYKGHTSDSLCVCHKDDNPDHNFADNLFLGTQKENNIDKKNKGRSNFAVVTTKIGQYTENNEFVKEWDSIKEAERFYGLKKIRLDTHYKSGGFFWKRIGRNLKVFSQNFITIDEKSYNKTLKKRLLPNNAKKVAEINNNGDIINIFNSLQEAAQSKGLCDGGGIRNVCNGKSKLSGGSKWKFV